MPDARSTTTPEVIDLADGGAAAGRTARSLLLDQGLRLLVESAVDYAIFTLDVDGRVATWNTGAERMKGYTADEIIGRHFSVFYAPDAVAAGHPQHELRLAERDGRYAEEGWRIRKGGGRFWAKVTITALHTPEGRLVGFGKVTRDLTERREAEERLARQATHDPLTGLANRSLMIDRLQMALARSERVGTALAVLFVDLDGFKLVNDTWGHHVGDVVLVEVARRLGSVVRAYDSVARLGGDEFVVTCEDCDEAGAHHLATRLLEAMTAPIAAAVTVSCSIGIALNAPGSTAEDLVRRADDAMYEAKQRGRAQHRFHHSGHESDAAGRLQLSQQLRRAIDGRELSLLYQPIVDVRSGAVVSVEALVRWDHPERGVLAPSEFLPVAEMSGLMASLGGWVLETACGDVGQAGSRLAGWTGSLAVNVSGHQLADARFAEQLVDHLEAAGFPPSRLCLETTETVLVRSDHSTRLATRRLRDLGVSLAIDDFGTGYSSLAYLRDLSFDVLKVDRTFTAGLRSSPVDQAIVRAVLSLAGSLGLPTVIEGVETTEELDRARQYGAHLVQGYLTGRPVPWDEACAVIAGGWSGPGGQ
jgi:diguanylate cyclase (GGDEF)-like protein/PAS domain S-box-containing protein